MTSNPSTTDVRKLQVTGGSTYILSLPKKWVTQIGLEKGGRVRLERQNDGTIILMPEDFKSEDPSDATIHVAVNEPIDFIVRKIVSAYLVGYNVIYIRSTIGRLDHNQRSLIKEFTRKNLVGTEIIADSPREMIIKVLLSYPELSVESALRRMCIITSSMHTDVMKALKTADMPLVREVIYQDNEVDRFSLYIIRQLKAAIEDLNILKEIGLSTRRDCLGFRLITKTVERTADHAVEIAENIVNLQEPPSAELYENIVRMSESAISIFNQSIEILYKQDFEAANRIVQNAKMAASKQNELTAEILQLANQNKISCLSLIVESIKRVAEYSSDIAEIVLNLNIDQLINS
jgi:phosphate uptake regulator